jgi:hypothetical protein
MSESDPFSPETKRELADRYQREADEAQAKADKAKAEADAAPSRGPSDNLTTGATSATVRVPSTPVVSVNG